MERGAPWRKILPSVPSPFLPPPFLLKKETMALPGVQIQVADGALGRTVATADGIVGLVLTGVAASGLGLGFVTRLNSLAEAVALGITATTHPHAYGQIADFYAQAGSGAELWIELVAETTTHAAVYAAAGPMSKLLLLADGRITIAGHSMGRAGGYAPSRTGLVDYDLPAVAAAAQVLAVEQAAAFSPVRIVLDGSYLISPLPGVIPSVKGAGDRVAVFVGVGLANGLATASMGRLLGRLAAIPVHQSVARVKTGSFSANGSLTSTIGLEGYTTAAIGGLHDAGYMALRTFQGKQGAFVTDDVTLAAATSDYTSLARGRVIDKAIRLAYLTYVEELNDTVEITEKGTLLPTKVSYIEDVILRALNQRLLAEGNCSGVAVSVDPNQNVIATDKIEVVIKITPLGYLKSIVVKLGFYNPAN